MPKLTQQLIASLYPDENKDRIVFDETVPGFGVREFRTGHKSYLIQYRSQKRTRRCTLGNCDGRPSGSGPCRPQASRHPTQVTSLSMGALNAMVPFYALEARPQNGSERVALPSESPQLGERCFDDLARPAVVESVAGCAADETRKSSWFFGKVR